MNIAAVSTERDAEARIATCDLMRRVKGLKQDYIARVLGIDQATISRVMSGEAGLKLEKLDQLLEVAGLKLVPRDAVVIDPKMLMALRVLAHEELGRQIEHSGDGMGI